MAKGIHVSTKRIQIDKANSTIVAAVGIAAFAVAFSLVASKALIARQSYQAKVITAQEKARDQLQANIDAVGDLKVKYAEFVSRQENIIKGSSEGDSERDGDNARIILDALPSKYDYPALVSSLEKILVDRNYKINSITGIDNELLQNGAPAGADAGVAAVPTTAVDPNTGLAVDPAATGATAGTAVEMPFEIGAEGSYKGMVELLDAFRKSIRPFYVQILSFTAGDDGNVQLKIQGKSYFQPERTLNITEEVVQ